MLRITALLHSKNDGLRLGRALETLYPCDELVVVDYGSRDSTIRIAREYGATVIIARPETSPEIYLRPSQLSSRASNEAESRWLLCLDPHESLTERLAASLFDWKSQPPGLHAASAPAFSFFLREETANGWIESRTAQTRLVPLDWTAWKGALPCHDPAASSLEGELLRFAFP